MQEWNGLLIFISVFSTDRLCNLKYVSRQLQLISPTASERQREREIIICLRKVMGISSHPSAGIKTSHTLSYSTVVHEQTPLFSVRCFSPGAPEQIRPTCRHCARSNCTATETAFNLGEHAGCRRTARGAGVTFLQWLLRTREPYLN